MLGVKNISNKNIVLTGTSSGIGKEVLRQLSDPKLGNNILAVSRTSEEKLKDYAPNITPMNADITKQEDIDRIFEKAESMFEKIDIFYNNAGAPFYEKFDYLDWARTAHLFDLNAIGPAYMYAKYIRHLNGRDGHLCYTVSCIGLMALHGYALYTASKFGMRGFQQAIRLEKPKNLKMTCLYPVGTDTGFFAAAEAVTDFEKPWPIMRPQTIATQMVKGMARGAKHVYPVCWCIVYPFMVIFPPFKHLYWALETGKLNRYLTRVEQLKK